ncbi:TPA: glycosyltransferase family 2 protein [Photobacterium damselae]
MFSIIVPLYNKEKSISHTIDSIKTAFSNYKFEIIIVNDGSTDNSLNVVNTLSQDNLVIFDKSNGGVSSARNYGIKKSKYDYLVFVDADDTLLEHTGDEYYKLIENSDNNTGIYSVGYAFKYDDKIIQYNVKKGLGRELWFGTVDNVLEVISKYKGSCFISCSSICVNKNIIIENNIKFPDGITHTEDLSFYYDLILLSKVSYSSKLCVYYNLDSDNRSSSSKPTTERYINKKIENKLHYLSSDSKEYYYSRSFLGKNYIHLVYNCIEMDDIDNFHINLIYAQNNFKYLSGYYKVVFMFFKFIPFYILRKFLSKK